MNDQEIPRDQYGRPLITPPGGGKPVAYTRASTLGSTLDDKTAITNWQMRNVVLGMAARPDLVALAAAKKDNKTAIGRIADDASEYALASSAANIGTAVHSYIEAVNNGEEPWSVPAELQADITAYRQAISKWEVIESEVFVVCDELKVAGTFDFRARSPILGRKRSRVWDLKTGAGAAKYGQNSIAVQLAVYAHGQKYDPATGERTPLDMDLNEAFVMHIVAGSGKATAHRVDIVKGWEGAQKAIDVRAWRKTKNLFTPFTEVEIAAAPAPVVTLATDAMITTASTIEHVREAYRQLVAEGHGAADVERACRARLAEIGAA